MSKNQIRRGSRKHILEWSGSNDFIPSLQRIVSPIGFNVCKNADRQPKSYDDCRESTLTNKKDSFLTRCQAQCVRDWWLFHKRGSKLPTWDLVIQAEDINKHPALVLVEAKARISELRSDGKKSSKRSQPEAQKRSDDNDERIGKAISEAMSFLKHQNPKIHLCKYENYQFCNRIAFSWKLASMGIPVVLVYLGFLGDTGFTDRIFTKERWTQSVREKTEKNFPFELWAEEIRCGAGSFWFLVESKKVLSPSQQLRSGKP
jgi:hypothetical protein